MRFLTPPFLGSPTSGGGGDATANVTGVTSTGAVGTATVTISSSVSITGVSTTGSVGTVSTTISSNVSVTGVSTTGSIGTVTVSTASIINVSVTGVSCTTAVGTPTLRYDYTYYVPVNLLTYSEDFTNAEWLVLRASKTTGQTAPDGSSNAVKLVEDNTAANTHYLYKLTPSAVRSSYPKSASMYAKKGERSFLVIVVRDNTNTDGFGYEFNLDAGTVSERVLYGNGQYINGTIESVGSGWYRCTATGYYTSAETQERTLYLIEETASTFNYNGDGSSGIYLWGGQLEQASAASPYTKTTSSSQSILKATSSIGTVTHSIGGSVTVTGVSATGSAGSVTISLVDVVNVAVTGISCTGSVGTVVCNYDYVHTLTGVMTTGAIGTVTVVGTGLELWTPVNQKVSVWTSKTQANSTWTDVNNVNSTWTEV